MPSTLKRKSPPSEDLPSSPKRRHEEGLEDENEDTPEDAAQEAISPEDPATQRARERQERFQSLKARQTQSRKDNRKETAAEAGRNSVDPSQLTALSRRHAIASHKLLKADAEAAGEDFERKRAWDWTIEESEKWDRRLAKKDKHRADVAFQDYTQDARKAYKRHVRALAPDMAAYEREKRAAVERAAQSGGLEVVETTDGELVAVDKDGTFYSSADSTGFVQNKPDREAVERLVADLKKDEEARYKKRRERGRDEGDADVTYINEKNKGFNERAGPVLQQVYDRDSGKLRERHSYLRMGIVAAPACDDTIFEEPAPLSSPYCFVELVFLVDGVSETGAVQAAVSFGKNLPTRLW